jgi:hypothetical protein
LLSRHLYLFKALALCCFRTHGSKFASFLFEEH